MQKLLHLLRPLLLLLAMTSIIRAVQQPALTAGGPTQSYTHSDFSAAEPVEGALVFLAPSTTAKTPLDHARLSIGFTDGTRQRCVSIRARDAQGASSDAVRNAFTTQVLSIYSASATSAAAQMALSSLADDGLVGTWGTLAPAAWMVNCLLFGGSGVRAYVGEFTCSASQDGTTVVDTTSDANFDFDDWNLLFLIGRGGVAFNASSSVHAQASIGVCVYDGSSLAQGGLVVQSDNGTGSEVSGCELDDDRVLRILTTGGPTSGDSVEITARQTGSGHRFTATKRGTGGTAPVVGFMALKLPDIQGIKLFSRDTRTSTGNDAWTDAAHAAQFLFSMSSSATSLNAVASGATDACIGIGAAAGSSASHVEFSSAITVDDGAATTDTKCVTADVFHFIPNQAGAVASASDHTEASLSSIEHNGATLNYAAVLGTARKQLILSVGRAKVMGTARGVSGAADRGAGKVSHAGRSRDAAGAPDHGAAKVTRAGRCAAQAGAIAQAQATVPSMVVAMGYSVGGAVSRAAATSAHAGRAHAADGAVEQDKASVAHGARARSVAGSAERSVAASAKGCRSSSVTGETSRAAGQVSHAARASAASGGVARPAGASVKGVRARAQASGDANATGKVAKGARAHAAAGAAAQGKARSAKGARSQAAAGAASYGQAIVISVGQVSGFSVAGAVSSAEATVVHGARARATAGEVGDATGVAAHAGRALGAPAEVGSAQATSSKGARARSAGQTDAGAAGRVAHGARSSDAAGEASQAPGKKAAAAQAHSAAGSAPQAQAVVVSVGQVSSRGVAGAVGSASGKVAHGGSARAEAGAPAQAAGKVSHVGKAAAPAGEVSKPAGKKTASGRARSAAEAAKKAPAQKTAAGRTSDPAGAIEQATGKASHGAQAAAATSGVAQAAGKVAHAGQARATGGGSGTVILTPPEILGFYAKTSRAVRTRLIAVAGALQIQHENLRFTEPSGTWARARVDFDEIQDAEYGSGKVSYLVPGTLEIDIRTRLREGKKALLDQAEALAAALQFQEVSGVVYAAASLRPAKDSGDDEFSAKLSIPFRSWDSAFPRAVGALPGGDDYSDAERAVRARFAAEIQGVAVSYDNLPPTTGATWVRLAVNEQEGFDAGGVRRTVGVMEASIHAPAFTGTKAALKLADRIVEAFRAVDVGGIVFDLPYLQRGRQVAGEWVLPVFCPWSCDHA